MVFNLHRSVHLSRVVFFCVLFMLPVLIAGCGIGGIGGGGGGNSPEDNPEDQVEIPPAITAMERQLLDIMQQADLVPVIRESSETGAEPTFDETIMGLVLTKEIEEMNGPQEQEEQMPETEEEIWDRIKTTLTDLHNQWNDLEPVLRDKGTPRDNINQFENTLDNLTVLSTEQNYFGVMDGANQLTGDLSDFIYHFAEETTSTAYSLKTHLRNILLRAAEGNYREAEASMDNMRDRQPVLTKTLTDDDAGELDAAMDNMQRAVEKQSLVLVQVNAAVLMEKLASAVPEE